MDFYEVLDQLTDLLKQRGRASYRAIRLQFKLDDDYLEVLKDELIKVHKLAVDKDGEMLVWTGQTGEAPQPSSQLDPITQTDVQKAKPTPVEYSPTSVPEAERRQLTVMFCDLVGSTKLSAQLDPEEYREIVRAYQATCAAAVARFDGHIAQYLGDGLLVYFGYPQAHEDDAQRAIRAGLGCINAMASFDTRQTQDQGFQLAVRIGIHTAPVVVGEIGTGETHERLALGETPNIAARLQGIATPGTVVISAFTAQLAQGYFECESLGAQTLRGAAEAMEVYQVLSDTGAQSRLDTAPTLMPLVGRDSEEDETHMLGHPVHQLPTIRAVDPNQAQLFTGPAELGKKQPCPRRVRDRGGCDHHQQEEAQRIDQDVAFPAFDVFPFVVAAFASHLGGLDALTVKTARRGVFMTAFLLAYLRA